MENEVERYVRGEIVVPKHDRHVARQGKQIYDDTRLDMMRTKAKAVKAAAETDAILAVAGHTMEGLAELDQRRQDIARDNQTLSMLLAEVEVMALRQAKDVQRRAFSPFGF